MRAPPRKKRHGGGVLLALGFSSSLVLNIIVLTHDSSWEASLQCESLCVASDHQPEWIICYNCYTCVAFLQCGWACVSSNFQLKLMIYRTLNSCLFSPLCSQISGLAEWLVASGTIELLFSTVNQEMLLQIESVTEWFATLVTSVLWILHYTANYFMILGAYWVTPFSSKRFLTSVGEDVFL